MSSIADIPLDILRNCIIPHVHGDMLHDIHQELRVRVAIDDLGDRPRESAIPLTESELEILLFFGALPGYSTKTFYLNGLNDSYSKITFVDGGGPLLLENENAGRWYFSLAVRRHVAIRMFKLMFPDESETVFEVVFRRVSFRLYEDFDRPFTLMLDTPFHQTALLYVSYDLQEPFFVRELIHRPGMVNLFDAFMDPVNRPPDLRLGVMRWRDIRVKDDGSICLFTDRRDRCRY